VAACRGFTAASFRLMAARFWFRQDRADQLENPDRSEPRLAIEPNESIEPTEAADPIDSREPADPMDKIEPVDPMDKIEPVDPIDKIEPEDPIDKMEPIEPSPLTDPSDPVKRRETSVICIAHSHIPVGRSKIQSSIIVLLTEGGRAQACRSSCRQEAPSRHRGPVSGSRIPAACARCRGSRRTCRSRPAAKSCG
jgi:hypothetical protein